MNGDGVFLGVTPGHPRLPVMYTGDGNDLVIAGTGSGKSRCVAIPNLINTLGSVVVTDFKEGELTAMTALYRSKVLGQKVTVFDPMHVVDDKHLPHGPKDGELGDGITQVPIRGRFDPIDFIRNSRSPLTAGYRVAEGFIPPGSLKETHWADGSQNYLNAIEQFVAFDPFIDEEAEAARKEKGTDGGFGRNLKTLWKILSVPALEKLALSLMVRSNDGFVSDQASAFYKVSKANTEIACIRNHLRVNLAKTLGEPRILESLSNSNVDFSTLNKEPQSIYFVLPGDMAQSHFRYMRLLNGMILSEIERSGLREHGSDQPPTIFVVDEANTLGNFPPFVEGMGRLRGLGVRFQFFYQSLSQAKATYGEKVNEITGNSQCIRFFGGTNDVFTAEYISKICGVSTIVTHSPTEGRAPNSGSESQSITDRPVIMPDEVMRLELPTELVRLSGKNVTFAELAARDFSDFPQYSQFMNSVMKCGMSPQDAAKRCRDTPVFRPPYYPPAPEPPPPPGVLDEILGFIRKRCLNPFKLVDWLLTILFGHETR